MGMLADLEEGYCVGEGSELVGFFFLGEEDRTSFDELTDSAWSSPLEPTRISVSSLVSRKTRSMRLF